MSQKKYTFPKGFQWGTATASYQIEGAAKEEGRAPSIWDAFCETDGAIQDASSGVVASDHFHRWKEDLKIMKDLGLDTYKFSVAWSRIIPGGTGALNPKGFDFYERLVDALLEAGIRPNCTLYHWDLPHVLEFRGGWHNRTTPQAFADYAAQVARRLGDRVDMWATLNEPQVFVHLGYEHGIHAPGHKKNRKFINQVIHHALLGHGLATKAIRSNAGRPVETGIVWAPNPIWPASDSAEDTEAATRHWRMSNDWWIEPVVKGAYPEDVWKLLGDDVPDVEPGDLEVISQPIDYMGINYYSPTRTAADPANKNGGFKVLPPPQDALRPSMPEWEIFPPGLENLLVQFKRHYGDMPMYISENGMSIADDTPGKDGKVHDARRIEFFQNHLVHVHRAIEAGVNVKGYYAWSLLDSFEWGYGYQQRFGIVHVNFKTQERTPKDSAAWYKAVINNHGFTCKAPPEVRSSFEVTPLKPESRNIFAD